jgi:beta-N-acetylhexosaminidase
MCATDLGRAVSATLMPGFAETTPPAWLLREVDDGLGSVCLFGGNVVDADQVRSLTAAIHGVRAPSLVAIDEEGGDVTRLHHREGSPHPAAAYLGRCDDVRLTRDVHRSIGAELRSVGVDLDLAPVADVNSDPRNPVIGVRSFGADPESVARHVRAAVEGLSEAGVAAVVKHFPGHGDTSADSHLAMPVVRVDRATLERRDLVPFREAVATGVPAVMTSHILVPVLDPAAPATMSAPVLRMLRDELGFTGAIVSDALDMAGASAECGVPEAAVRALSAGVDLLCLGTDNTAEQVRDIRRHVLAAVAAGRLTEERIRDAASHVDALAARFATEGARLAVPPPSIGPAGFWLRGPLAPAVRPLLLRLETPANIAAGPTPWGIGPHLGPELARLPGAVCATASDLDQVGEALRGASGRTVVVQGKDVARLPFLTAAAAFVRERRPDAVLVDLGWPVLPGDPPLDVATFGASRGQASALVTLLAEGAR